MKKLKQVSELFKFSKIELIHKVNNLELENETLKKTIKDELYKTFIAKLEEPQEFERYKKENKNLRMKVKTLKQLLKGDTDAR